MGKAISGDDCKAFVIHRMIILFGYYGFQNVGDEQLLDETVRIIKPRPFVVANGPVSAPFPTFSRRNLWQWWRHCRKASHIVMGGGSVFQSQTSVLSLLYYVCIVCMARVWGCSVLLLCHGWGPFKCAWHQSLAVWCVTRKHVQRSWRHNTGIPAFANDPVFCDLVLTQPLPKPSPGGKHVGILLRSNTQTKHVINMLGDTPYRCLTTGVDTGNTHGLIDHWNTQALDIGYVITDRYHGAIWASRHGIAWCAISKDPKLTALAIQSNQPIFNSVEALNSHPIHCENTRSEPLRAWVAQHATQRERIQEWLYAHIGH
jgi:polysaccharide pyruvyl transferase WcaK-like protein